MSDVSNPKTIRIAEAKTARADEVNIVLRAQVSRDCPSRAAPSGVRSG